MWKCIKILNNDHIWGHFFQSSYPPKRGKIKYTPLYGCSPHLLECCQQNIWPISWEKLAELHPQQAGLGWCDTPKVGNVKSNFCIFFFIYMKNPQLIRYRSPEKSQIWYNGSTYKQCSGSGTGSVLDPYSGALWIRIHTCKNRIK